jgi:hypothetical protein
VGDSAKGSLPREEHAGTIKAQRFSRLIKVNQGQKNKK